MPTPIEWNFTWTLGYCVSLQIPQDPWPTIISLTASPSSQSFVKGNNLLCFNYTCDCVPSGLLTCTNAQHVTLEKRWSRRQDGGYRALAGAVTCHRGHPLLHQDPDPTASETLSWHLALSSFSLRQGWLKIRLHHVRIPCPLPQVSAATAVTTTPRESSVAPTVPGGTDSVLLKGLSTKIPHFFLCVVVHAHKHLAKHRQGQSSLFHKALYHSKLSYLSDAGEESKKKVPRM